MPILVGTLIIFFTLAFLLAGFSGGYQGEKLLKNVFIYSAKKAN